MPNTTTLLGNVTFLHALPSVQLYLHLYSTINSSSETALSFQTDKYKIFMYAAGNFGFKTTQLEIWIKYNTNTTKCQGTKKMGSLNKPCKDEFVGKQPKSDLG